MNATRRRFSLTPPQRDHPELLDLGKGSPEQVALSLADIGRLNTWLGASRQVTGAVLQLLDLENGPATVLDIGTGAADIPRYLQARATRRNLQVCTIGLDNNPRHLRIAQQRGARASNVQLVQGDAFSLPFADGGVDVVMSTLFLHHFRAPQVSRLLREFDRVSRIGWVANDLVRHCVPLAFLRLTWPVFARSYLTRHDGIASIRRGYTIAEMRAIVGQSELRRVEVRDAFPFRMSIVAKK